MPHAVYVVWQTLTTGELIGRWLMPNDFELVVGKRFTFQAQPLGRWDGIVHCQVLEVIPYERFVTIGGRFGRKRKLRFTPR